MDILVTSRIFRSLIDKVVFLTVVPRFALFFISRGALTESGFENAGKIKRVVEAAHKRDGGYGCVRVDQVF